jgi:glycosyltransferase involved in cell wall biosynthesis
MKPRISVVMPVWNGEAYLREAIDSILSQTFTDFELIIVDDGSTDGTAQILQSYRDTRIRIVQEGHLGFVGAVNRGVAAAYAEWIARQDADDISLPTRLEKQWEAIQKQPAAVFCYIDIKAIGDQSRIGRQPRLPRSRALVALKSCFQCPVCVGAALIKRSTFLEAGGYREEEFPAEDYAFVSRVLAFGNMVGVPQVLYEFRKHDQQISHTKLKAQKQKTRMVALTNCQNVMRLPEQDAARAQAVLSAPPRERKWRDWLWFLIRCAPALRWKSVELYLWLLLQTARQCLARFAR